MSSDLDVSPDMEQIIGKMPLDQQRKLRGKMGKFLRAARKKQSLQQEEAAQLIGISRPHLSNVEQGRSRPGWEGIQRMALVYGIGIQELIDSARAAEAAEPAIPANYPIVLEGQHRLSGLQNIIQYEANNLDNYEKSIMRDFHVLSSKERAEVIEQIRLKIQTRLRTSDAS